jgi:MFS family permease
MSLTLKRSDSKAAGSRQWEVSVYAALVAFLTYASVYAYRKPFTVAEFHDLAYWGIRYQTLLIIFQGTGYMLSKFYGIRFISELKRMGRWKTAITLIGIAWFSLFLFAIVPPVAGLFCLLLNGFALGFMWGIVFSYIEGRKATDFIGSAMAVSFIFAGGFTRTVAKWLLVEWQVSERWMPFVTGLVFVLPLLILIYLLERIPLPDTTDVEQRAERVKMNNNDRKVILAAFGSGLFIITLTYVFLTIIRDLRDNFMSGIWTDLGYGSDYGIFTRTETITSVTILVLVSMLVLVKKNMQAFRLIHLLICIGFILTGLSSFLFIIGFMDGAFWMQLVGLGLYMAYIPFNCIFFERMIATFKMNGNAGFLMYLADSFGYAGTMLVMLAKELLIVEANWSEFYARAALFCAIVGVTGILFSLAYFNRKYFSAKTFYYG